MLWGKTQELYKYTVPVNISFLGYKTLNSLDVNLARWFYFLRLLIMMIESLLL